MDNAPSTPAPVHVDWSLAASFLADFPYDRELIEAALARRCGRVFTDNHKSPSVMILWPGPGGADVSIVAGDQNFPGAMGVVHEYMEFASTNAQSSSFLTLPSIAWRDKILAEFSGRFLAGERISYAYDKIRAPGLATWMARLPDGMSIRPIDRALAERIGTEIEADFDLVWQSADEFLSESIGYCVTAGDAIASVACSSFPSVIGSVSIMVATQPEYRGSGLSPIACAPLIEYCIERNLQPRWTTDATNPAAQAVARKLGFVEEHRHWWLYLKR